MYSQSCASPDIAEAIFETRGTNQVCEWLNDGFNGDSICYCKSDECNTIETLASWIQNGGLCEFCFSYLFFILISFYSLKCLWPSQARVQIKNLGCNKEGKMTSPLIRPALDNTVNVCLHLYFFSATIPACVSSNWSSIQR